MTRIAAALIIAHFAIAAVIALFLWHWWAGLMGLATVLGYSCCIVSSRASRAEELREGLDRVDEIIEEERRA